MDDPDDLVEKWTSEFAAGGVPSSAREEPSGAVVWAVETLKQKNIPLKQAIDVGCGRGRNSLYLAAQGLHVTAMDFTPNAVRHLQEQAQARGLQDRIRPLVQDVAEAWPVPDFSADLVVDAFCFKHLAPHEARAAYKSHLLRALRTRGHYVISFASIGDGYYGRYVTQKNTVNGEEEHVVVTPANGIESVLFTRKGVVKFFAPELDVFMEIENNRPVTRHGATVQRSAYALLLRRNPHLI